MTGDADRPRPAPAPILVLGVSRRSGTNYLGSLLLCHRDCVAPQPPLTEDHLLAGAQDLERYVRNTARRWPRRWGDRDAGAERLRAALGDGLLKFVSSPGEKRVVTRTPSVANLDLVPQYLTGADVVVLVRDGRSVAASFEAAWEWPFDLAVLEWRRGAREILALQERLRSDPDAARVLVIRYEDVVAETDSTIDRLLAFTGLDPDGLDRERARDLPVLGSSFARDDAGRVTWEPRVVEPGFDPTDRHSNWPDSRHDRYAWLAGEEHLALGYTLQRRRPSGSAVRMRAADLLLPVRTGPWRLRRVAENAARATRAEWRARQGEVSRAARWLVFFAPVRARVWGRDRGE